jgi:hypothetical protein
MKKRKRKYKTMPEAMRRRLLDELIEQQRRDMIFDSQHSIYGVNQKVK